MKPGEHLIEISQPHRPSEDVIPGSERCEIDIVGSAMGAAVETSVKDPESLLLLPTGCGEQTMSKLAPTLYAYQYLDTVGRISPEDKARALDYIKKAGGLYVPACSDTLSVLGTSYALMALLNAGESRNTITDLVKWLNLRMNPSGSLDTTQDTVVALQALSKYAIYARDDEIDMTCEVTQVEPREDNRGQPVFSRTLRINRRNADVRNRITFDLSVNFQRATVTVDRSPDLIGTEGDLVNKTRTVKSRENCKSFNLTTDHEYVVMGMDAKYKEELHPCGEQYVYVIDSESMVIPYPMGIQQQKETKVPTSGRFQRLGTPRGKSDVHTWNDLVVWFVTEFSKEMRCHT
ncbi:hypothetical protein V5799_033365 [Amblyomma americanum]|uniref:Uncharacterized protein n=1 Tax=Amblyomma americanum TaxID=6943 RepID=A0AAQ4DNI5_AMBAM